MSEAEMWEIGPVDAKEALRNGHEKVLAVFLSDAAAALSSLAARTEDDGSDTPPLLPANDPPTATADNRAAPHDDEWEWEGTANQVMDALNNGQLQLVAQYLRDLADVLRMVSTRLSSTLAQRDWQLRFIRKHAGRRPDPNTEQLHTRLRMELRFAKAKGIKQESVIADLEERYDVSRSTIMRAMRPSKLRR